jgi:hypothetical protein
MNYKTTYTLFGLLAAVLVLFGIVIYRGSGPEEGKGAYVLPSVHDSTNPLKADQVTRVEIEQKRPQGPTLVFERPEKSEKWQITRPRPLPADNMHIDDLVREVLDAQQQPGKKRGLKEAGLDNPARVITLRVGDEREVRLNLGETTPGEASGVVYVTSSDLPKTPLTVRLSELSAALKDLAYFRSHDLLGRDTGDIRSLRVSEGKKAVALEKAGDRWRMVEPPYGTIDPGQLIEKVGDLRVEKDEDFVADGVTGLAKYHLGPKDDLLRVRVGRPKAGAKGKAAPTQTLVIGVGKKAEAPKKDTEAGGAKEDKYYAYVDTPGEGKEVVKVPAAAVEPFRKVLDDPESLRSRTLVQIDNFRQPDTIDVQNSYGKLQFRRPDAGKPWVLYRDGTAHAVDDTEMRVLVDKLTEKNQIQSFPDPKRAKELGLGKGKADATVTVWADALEPPDKEEKKDEKDKKDKKDKKKKKDEDKKNTLPKFKKDAKPVAVLRFGIREKKSVAVERKVGDDVTLAMVPDDLLDVVRRGPLAYFDRSLPMFNATGAPADDVTRLVIDRDGATYEVTREKSEAPWKIVKPKTLAGRDADARVVEDILGRLNRLRALEVVAEKPAAADLDKLYRLKSPPYKAVVTVKRDGKETKTEFDFGKESPDKKGVYARVTGKDAVYVVGSNILDQLKKDLQDPTVLSFDVDKVQSLKLRGWQQIVGETATREFVRKDGTWVAKVPAGFKVSADKVNDFLRGLSHLRAERFVSIGEGRKPAQALKLAEGALIIEITVEGKKEPLKLTVGGVADKDRTYYADSKQLGKDVFTLPQGLFKEVKEKPAYFRAS